MARTKPFNRQQNKEFSARARSVIERRFPGARLDDLSSLIGIQADVLTLLLDGKRQCSMLNAVKIAMATEAPIQWLLLGTGCQPVHSQT